MTASTESLIASVRSYADEWAGRVVKKSPFEHLEVKFAPRDYERVIEVRAEGTTGRASAAYGIMVEVGGLSQEVAKNRLKNATYEALSRLVRGQAVGPA
ncbi:MAG: hypothetical protein FJZ00_01940 [Candidatus Sericytochromatia bacterium]|uniref:Uncharacterized protein n=1 Tax=Candidatus Tanganyikabacteria bacterium TaxID=2961651 RepID=A0A937X484_9BACT|nr:hypothetical protein [Candidatus Tanganyikabacteria bacterium]